MSLKFSISNNAFVFICSILYCLYFVTNNIIFSILPIIICLTEIKKALHILIIFIVIALYFLFIDFYNSKDILLLSFSIFLFYYKFKDNNPLDTLKWNSYAILTMLLLFLLLQPIGGWAEVLSYKSRLSFELWGGKFINPNPLGLVSAICAIGLLINKKYFFSFYPIFTMFFTQSRAALLFFFVFLILYYMKSVKNFLITILIFLIFFYFSYNTPVIQRIIEGGDSGRGVYLEFYENILKNNYITGYSIRALDEIYINSGRTIDQMYFSLFIRYGFFMGGIILLIFIYLFFLNRKDEYFNLRYSILIAFLAYGFFEKGFLFFYMAWIPMSLCYNNLKNSRI